MLSFCQKGVEMAFNHSIIQSFNHSIIQTSKHPIIQTSNHSNIQSFKHPSIQASKHSNIQAFKHPSIQTSKHSNIQSSNQAIKQRYHTFIAFTKTDLKIPYSLLFPLLLTLSLTRTTFLKNLIP
ncbi:hypothetical protein [Helicobacter pylori]|uniref:hypothetical protein n=1 Tax=Helicobacter pylori TaxID=210 RepID=UPI003CC627A7